MQTPVPLQPARTFQDLIVWQKAHRYVLKVYTMTASFPKHELFGLTAQMRRAAVSIAANIAEGFSRRTRGDKMRFFDIAQASLDESRYFLILARDLGYIDKTALPDQLEEVGRLVGAYRRGMAPP